MEPKDVVADRLFSIIFATFSEDRFLDAFWSPFGSSLAPFWLPLAAFWLPLAHFWLPLAPFWLTFGSLWLTFGALGLTFAHPGARFPHFWALLASFFTFLNIFDEILRKILLSENVHCKSDYIDQAHRIPTIFDQFSIKIQVRDRYCRILLQDTTAGYHCRILLQDESRSILQYPAVSCSSILQ